MREKSCVFRRSYATDIGETKSVADAATGRVSHVAASAMMHTSAEVTNHGKAASSVTVKVREKEHNAPLVFLLMKIS